MQLNIHGFTILDTSPYHKRTVADKASLNKIHKIRYGVLWLFFFLARERVLQDSCI